MTPARTEMLARVRAAIADGAKPPPVIRDYRRSTTADVDLIARFTERVADYHATVYPATPADLSGVIARVLAERAIVRLVVPAGVPPAWLDASTGLERLVDDPPLTHAALEAADGVITDCAVGIAETGTIVLDAGSGQGRRALTLLPDRHICVVDAGRLVGDVPEALARLTRSRPLTWISGPSATSDIELQRVEGVHGPRILDVILVSG